ncbi:hypothetical protein [Alteromonas mediterranea]|uniref:Uncharacterized protein n=2 Tax=Alteromonas mediterranea TaxID=314275 RepID=S5AJ10_9ALTE|nr:hypothetical protein [Alteromonas mediterranea]AGP79414.1 hypothetical protein I633_19130 [Alteromonas mediterranea 615]MEA3381586.1 hypothetical protein [Pseudomonadota bacterium]AFV87191.1 hypothetical protein amad1_18570 [Alteromonas mediterranea DE1]AGP83441.1 hypothetical protein I533_17450 [Alteromonas mediterranea MED64]AGP99207.1 hypothetical protein I635_18560 [Alteromonas mediterranea UM7]
MKLTPLARLYMACAMLGLLSFSAFIANNHLLLLFHQVCIGIILWVLLLRPKLKTSKLDTVKIKQVVVSTFSFITTLTIGVFVNQSYKWLLVIAAVGVSIWLYTLLAKNRINYKE